MTPLWPSQGSTLAGPVDSLVIFMLSLACLITLGVYVAIIAFTIRYRRRSPDEVPQQTKGSTRLEIIWTAIPSALALVVFFWGANLYFQISRPPDDTMEVYVIGRQWMWKFVHASGREEINELHVPVNTNIKLTMTSQDVIHDVFVPDFRVKADVIPERYTTEWFNATQLGQHHLFCSQYCGTNHAEMLAWVYVLSKADFQNWQGVIPVTGGSGAPGEQLFQSLGCAGCHHPDGSGRGPSLVGVFGSQVHLSDGSTVVADENYIRESVLNPNAKVVAGYEPIMPTFQGQLDADQLLQLVLYIKSLGGAPAPTPGATP